MNFVSAGVQEPEVMTLLPLAGVDSAATDTVADAKPQGHGYHVQTMYDFSPEPRVLLDELLPLTVKSALFQAFLDATTSEHIARMVAMKSATDNADKMAKALTT